MAVWVRLVRRWAWLFLGLSLLSGCGRPHTFGGTELKPAAPASEIALTDQYGKSFSLSAQRGKVVLMYFGYTACPDVCPATLGTFKSVRQQLGSAADNLRLVFITVDPDRDTPDVLRAYLGRVDPAILGLSGPRDALAAAAKAYGVHFAVNPALDPTGHSVEHTDRIFAVDRAGNWRVLYTADVEPSVLAADVQALLAE
jgi:protein SCO1/2